MYFSFKVLLILSFCCYVCGDEIKNLIFKYKYRDARYCKRPYNTDEFQPFYRNNILENPLYLIFLIFLGMLFILMLLGIIKGLIGFCSKVVGEFGLGLLVDLPKPLDQYREEDLKYRHVCYDVGGWPVHPDTNERTVRVLPKKTEFCLNVIFFMAYPLALILQLCALCCCIKNYNDSDEPSCFKSVNIIKCTESSNRKGANDSPGRKVDKYRENDAKEYRDTRYVVNMMKHSQISLLHQG